VYLRGKAHVEWRITRGGERRTVKEDQYFIDEKAIVWGRGTTARCAVMQWRVLHKPTVADAVIHFRLFVCRFVFLARSDEVSDFHAFTCSFLACI